MEHWDKIRPGLWIDKRNRYTGESIWWKQECQDCPFRAELEMTDRVTSFCLWGVAKLLTQHVTRKKRKCFKDRQSGEVTDTKEWVKNNIYYSPENIPPQFKGEWQWTFPGDEWSNLMGKIGRAKTRKQRKINFASPEGEN